MASMSFPNVPNWLNKLVQLIKLLQEANQREEQAKEHTNYWHGAYQQLTQDYIALQFGDLCSEYKQVNDGTDPAVRPIPSVPLAVEKGTPSRLTLKLKQKETEKSYWQECYKTLLSEHYGKRSDGHYQRV